MPQRIALDASRVLAELKKLYHPPRTFLRWRTPLDLLVATVLSAQCTDAQVNRVTETLYRKYRTPEDYLSVPREELERDVHACGTYRRKAQYIQEMCRMLVEHHVGQVPDSMEALTALPGVGRKTAAIILWAVFGKTEGIAVDTHVQRVAVRLGLSRGTTPERIEQDLMAALPRKCWGEITTLLISHGRAVCTARHRHCQHCVFRSTCPSSTVLRRRDRARHRSRT